MLITLEYIKTVKYCFYLDSFSLFTNLVHSCKAQFNIM